MDLRQLQKALAAFRVLSPTHFYVHFAEVFLCVATSEKGSCTFREIEKSLNLSNSGVSRTVNALSDVNRKGQDGFDLLEMVPDPAEGRRFIVRLTQKGEAFKRQLDLA